MGKIDKAKLICEAYKNGYTISQIGRAFGHGHCVIENYLKRYYQSFYGELHKPKSQKISEYLDDLYNRYKEIYVPSLYSREKLCEILGCKVYQLECMFTKYNLTHQWLKTYESQATLCNTSLEFREAVKDFAKKYGYRSVRAVAVRAINEFMLQHELEGDNE